MTCQGSLSGIDFSINNVTVKLNIMTDWNGILVSRVMGKNIFWSKK